MSISETTNEMRAYWASEALDLFARLTDMRNAGEDNKTIMTDLVADLMHLAVQEDIEWSEVLTTAEGHFEAEAKEAADAVDAVLGEPYDG